MYINQKDFELEIPLALDNGISKIIYFKRSEKINYFIVCLLNNIYIFFQFGRHAFLHIKFYHF